MFIYFDATSGTMTGYCESHSSIDKSEVGEAERLISRDYDTIVYYIPNWEPEPITLEDGRTWVENELKYIVEKNPGWLEEVSDYEKLARKLSYLKSSIKENVKDVLQEKVAEITENVEIGYIFGMKDIAAKLFKNNPFPPTSKK